MRARLDVETLKERVRAGEARVVQLERQRERERDAAAEAARRAVIRRAQREIAARVADAAARRARLRRPLGQPRRGSSSPPRSPRAPR